MQNEHKTAEKSKAAFAFRDPVARLLTLSPVVSGGDVEAVDYLQMFGFTSEHIPELLRMATDPLLYSEDATDEEYGAPFHAVRSLTALHAVSALDPLLAFRMQVPQIGIDNERLDTGLRAYFAAIGAVAIPSLEALLKDQSQEMYTRGQVTESFEAMVAVHPELRAQVITILTQQLPVPEKEEVFELPSSIALSLIKLKAVESVAEIKRAYDAGVLDGFIVGDWEYIEYELGLREEPPEGLGGSLNDLLTLFNPVQPARPAQPKDPAPNRQKSFKKTKPKKKTAHKKGPRK